jgi:predicted short-subunit dehydrogenase-like oxidoreductase (DUF2520 family)
MIQHSISFVGAGKVASVLCSKMYQAGYVIDLIVSHSENGARILSDACKASFSQSLIFSDSTKIIIVAVPDHQLISVLGEIKCKPQTLILHTAGSYGLEVFPEHIKLKGVFYPLQTFTKGRKADYNDIPFLLESADAKSSEVMKNLAESIGGKVHFADTEKRRKLHLCAVFVCNFTNYMLTCGKEIALESDISFEILLPLLKETISKAIDIGPENAQTGPALRNDKNTIEKHLELLSFSADLQKIYNDMTRSIMKYYNVK